MRNCAAAARGSIMHSPPTPARGAIHRIDASDDVAVAIRALEPGEVLVLGDAAHQMRIQVLEPIPCAHKLAIRAITAGSPVRKYGWPIGQAKRDIPAGTLVHTDNLTTLLTGLDRYEYQPTSPVQTTPGLQQPLQFMGYRRRDGHVGTRNEIWVVSTVGCVTRTAERIASLGAERFGGRVDGVHALTHPFGCSQLGDDLAHTRRLLASLILHPNAGGVLVIGLGCESNQLDRLLAEAGDYD